MFDPAHLRSFLAVSQTLSFTQGARRLGLRQPTVSEHIRKLEAECGRRLFLRDTHSVRLTIDGEAMAGFARSMMDVEARARLHFGRDEMRGRIRLGLSEDLVLTGLAQMLRQFTRHHPGVAIELTVDVSEILRTRLEHGDVDLALVKQIAGTSNRAGELIWQEPLVWISAPDFPLDLEMPLPLVLLAAPAITRAAAIATLERAGAAWRLACTSSSQSGVHAAVKGGLGVAPHARSLVPPGLVEIAGSRLPPLGDVEFVVIGSRRTQQDPYRALVETIKYSGPLLREGRH